MQPTYIGAIAALIGILAMTRPMTVMLMTVICATIFGAASAANLTALGGSSIVPAVFLLLFLGIRIVRSPHLLSDKMESSLRDSALFGLFVGYGVLSAFLMPRLFLHQIELPPTKIIVGGLFAVAPLAPSSQNITQATYLVGTFVMLLATVFIARTERRSRLVAMTLIYLAIAHIAFGILDLIDNASGLKALDVVRNASYSIVDQEVGGFHRIQGAFAETSSYSTYGCVLLVFVTELWLRQVEPRLTGWVSLALMTILFFTTSSSAYVGLGAYGVVLALRLIYFPSTVGQRKALMLIGLGVLGIVLVLGLFVAMPNFVASFSEILADMTTNKTKSESGIQRGFWVQKGWDAFIFTKGLGVGVGSFRSSSLLSAIAGATGVFGVLTFFAFCYKVLPAHRLSIYRLQGTKTEAVGSAAGWAAIIGLASAMVSAANPDPGLMFAFMAGLAIAWAPYAQHAPAAPAFSWRRTVRSMFAPARQSSGSSASSREG